MHFYMLVSSIKTQITTYLVTFGGSVLKTIINQDICDTFIISAYDIHSDVFDIIPATSTTLFEMSLRLFPRENKRTFLLN